MKTNLFKLMSTALVAFAVTMVFTSCCEDDDPKPIKFSTSSSLTEFAVADAPPQYIDVEAINTDWDVSCEDNWVSVKKEVNRVRVAVEDNKNEELRESYVIINCKENATLSVKYHITQKGKRIDLDASAGSFEVKNLSAHESAEQVADVVPTDTFVIKFSPKQDYENFEFAISCSELKKINDSIFVVPNLETGNNDITLEAVATAGNYIYKATHTMTLKVPESYIIIPMNVVLSADLEPLVDVEMSYTDIHGNERRYLIKDEDWVRPDSASFYEYIDEEGRTVYSGRVPDGCTIVREEKYAPNHSFSLDARFLNITSDVTTTFTARYSPKQSVELNREDYYFTHGIDRKSARVNIPGKIVIDSYSSFNIDMTDHTVMRENVAAYLEELSNKPDVKKFKLSTSGDISTVK